MVGVVIPIYLDVNIDEFDISKRDEIMDLTEQCVASLVGYDKLFLVFDKKGDGFAKTANRGLRQAMDAGCKYIALVNNDTKMLQGSLLEMCKHGSVVRPNLIEGALAKFAFVVMDRSVIEQVGYLDEQFEIGFFEDDDYLRRCREKDIKIIDSPLMVWHKGGATISQRDPDRLMRVNRQRYEDKYNSSN